MVSFFQHLFVEDRQILYMVLIENEIVDSRIKSASMRFICKYDI